MQFDMKSITVVTGANRIKHVIVREEVEVDVSKDAWLLGMSTLHYSQPVPLSLSHCLSLYTPVWPCGHMRSRAAQTSFDGSPDVKSVMLLGVV